MSRSETFASLVVTRGPAYDGGGAPGVRILDGVISPVLGEGKL